MTSGLTPIPKSIEDKCASAEGIVEVRYSHSYRCVSCGWEPTGSFGCLPAMEKHLRDQHGYSGKMLWIDGYGSDHIKKAVEALPKALDLLIRCYKAGHREGWQDGETNAEVFEAVNSFLTNQYGPDWGPRLVDIPEDDTRMC